MIQVEILALVLTGIGIIVSILYYTSVLQNANKTQQMQLETRQTQLHIQIFNELNSEKRWKEFLDTAYSWEWDGYDDFHNKYGRGNPEVYAKLTSMWWVYNSIGTMIYDGVLDAMRLYPLIGPMVIMQWDRWEDIIIENRERINQPEAFIHFEYLAKEMLRVRKLGYRDEYVAKIIQMEP